MTFSHDDPGTDERAWRAWGRLDLVPQLDWDGVGHVVVVAAHPDDESLGCGGLIAEAARRGLAVDVVVATLGEASHPGSPTVTPKRLAQWRAGEVVVAVRQLAPQARVHLLRLPDGQLSDHVATVRDAVVSHATPGCWVLAPWVGDGHPDHSAAAAGASEAASAVGATSLEYPVWAWHWATPADPRVPWGQLVRLPLDAAVRDRKRKALAAHRSQTQPLSDLPGDEALLAPGFIAHFDRPHELFVASSPPGPRLGPAFFDDFYRDNGPDPWGYTDRWYEERKRALTLACLPRRTFSRAVEVGCSVGVLTTELAPRCDALLAVDLAKAAVEEARRRTAGMPGVEVRRMQAATGWPEGTFDLIVLSEVGYYLDGAGVVQLLDWWLSSLTEDGVLLLCHWRHPVSEYPLRGDEVHRRALTRADLAPLVRHEEEDFLLDVLVRPPARSVARASGLLPG
ncbi:MAG: PIG-L family deacetylase [Oryzihumus sp.]